MDGNKSVTATFNTTTTSYTLTVTKSGTGSGTVTSSPSGINCGSQCSASFTQGTSVTLTATASAGSTFAGWSGACSGTGTCFVTMDANKSVTATFSAISQAQASAISAGTEHTCALTSSGAVKCWGWNGNGQLGDGTNTDKWTPVQVSGLTSGVSGISAGDDTSCAVHNGAAKCWGYNGSGELGDGTYNNRNVPADVSGLSSGVIAIAAGGGHTCALTTTGAVKCWGYNEYGQLGDGTNNHRNTPVQVSGLTSGVSAISAGYDHTCALTSSGGVKCWGWNYVGQLGDGTNTDKWTPVQVSGLTSGVSAISAGFAHTCALTISGGIKCWGRNAYGQLGNGNTISSNVPVDVIGFGP